VWFVICVKRWGALSGRAMMAEDLRALAWEHRGRWSFRKEFCVIHQTYRDGMASTSAMR
jgi:hypothetical protein